MQTSYNEEDDNLTDEGDQMWKNIAARMLPATIAKIERLPIAAPKYQKEYEFLVLQIKTMIQNSKDVVRDCDNIIAQLVDAEAYFASEAKTAKKLHLKNIDRLERVLAGTPAFDYEVKMPEEKFEEKLNKLYHRPKR